MSKTTIQVAYLDEPREGKKTYSVKSSDGQRFGIFPEKVKEFGVEAGKAFEIEYSSREYQGKTYHTITKATAVNGSNGGNGSAPVAVNGGTSREDYWARKEQREIAKEPRIERQAAQKAAIETLKLAQAMGFPPDVVNMTGLFDAIVSLTDKFAADTAENAGTIKVATLDEELEEQGVDL